MSVRVPSRRPHRVRTGLAGIAVLGPIAILVAGLWLVALVPGVAAATGHGAASATAAVHVLAASKGGISLRVVAIAGAVVLAVVFVAGGLLYRARARR